MVHALIVLAAEKAESSKTAFYLCGGLLAAWAVVLGFVGLRSPDFPGSRTAALGIIALPFVLMVAVMATAVITA
jgi:hypothetical protein